MRKSLGTAMVLVSLMIVLLVGMPTRAQEIPTPNPSPLHGEGNVSAAIQPVATPALTVEVVPGASDALPVKQQPVNDNTIYVIGFLVLAALFGVREFISNRQINTLIGTVGKVLDNKQVLDEATRSYMQSSLQVQEFIKLLNGVTGFVGTMIPGEDLADKLHDFGDKVVSGDAGGVG